MQKTYVGVVRGGSNIASYKKSISNGSIILRALREHDEYEAFDILIDQNEVWHLDGVPILPSQLIHKIDICISVIDHPLGKHGYVERIIESLGIKCVSTPKSALLGYISPELSRVISSAGVRSSRHIKVDQYHDGLIKTLHNTFSPPYSVSFVNKFGEIQPLFDATNFDDIVDIFTYHKKTEPGEYLIEEYIAGDEWAVTVMPEFRGVKYFTLHPVYKETVYPAFRSNLEKTIGSRDRFANPAVRETLDLYAKLAASSMDISVPTTFTFRHFPDRKPVLMRIKERHLLHDDSALLNALKENSIKESDFLHMLLP